MELGQSASQESLKANGVEIMQVVWACSDVGECVGERFCRAGVGLQGFCRASVGLQGFCRAGVGLQSLLAAADDLGFVGRWFAWLGALKTASHSAAFRLPAHPGVVVCHDFVLMIELQAIMRA